jgi:hypothetical protein
LPLLAFGYHLAVRWAGGIARRVLEEAVVEIERAVDVADDLIFAADSRRPDRS